MSNSSDTLQKHSCWSHANLAGRNFSRQLLQNSCFSVARSGITRFGQLPSYLLAHVIGHLLGFIGAMVGYFLLAPGIATGFTGIGSLVILLTLWLMLYKRGLGRAVAVVTGIVILYGTISGIAAIAFRPTGVSDGTLLLASAFTLLVGGVIGAITCYSGARLVIGRWATLSMIMGTVINLVIVPNGSSDIAQMIAEKGVVGLALTSTLSTALLGFCRHISNLVLAESPQHSLLRRLAIAWSSLGNTRFYKTDLTGADFSRASLKGADFRRAKLHYVNWRGAKGLKWARWGDGKLTDNRVVELVTQELDKYDSYCNVNLRFTNLESADLSHLNLAGSDLTGAILRGANLEGTILKDVRAVGADFTGALLTGACIENWSIDASTKLQKVDCRFVFLRESPKSGTYDRDRQPASGEFEPGDFEQLYQTVIDTFELIFRNGLDWKTFQASLE